MALSREQLEQWLESWARWEHQGGQLSLGGGVSLLGLLIERKGDLQFGGGSRGGPVVACIEEAISLAVSRLYQDKPDWAIALRVEYGVQHLPGLSQYARPADRARALGCSLRTYQERLQKARRQLATALQPRRP